MANNALFATVLLGCILFFTPNVVGEIACPEVVKRISGCLNYARVGGHVPAGCCNGVRTLNTEANSTMDRRSVCTCLKMILRSIPGINMDFLGKIPGSCKVQVGYPISFAVDCTKVN